MSGKIKPLDEQTINQIAAGEVVENAASCVKELVENAIDAQATRIEVHAIAGGQKQIVIHDNGCGMSFDEVRMAILRHATSKIKTIGDLNVLRTMGFRGEALASIAAVSRLIVHSSNGKEASQLTSQGGKIVDHRPLARNRGTSIEVNALFYNVPAREAFQKSAQQERRLIEKQLIELALAYPHIEFKWSFDQKDATHLQVNPTFSDFESLRWRISHLFGSEVDKHLKQIDQHQDGVSLKGFLVSEKLSRPNRQGQHLFINHRSVESLLISKAVRDGYSTRLPENRFPLFFLNIEVHGNEVDVNVHPQKKEVRFKQPEKIAHCVTSMIQEALSLQTQIKLNPSIENKKLMTRSCFSEQRDAVFNVSDFKVLMRDDPDFFPDPALQVVPNVIGLFKNYIFLEAQSIASQMALKETEQDGLLIVHATRAHQRILFEKLMLKTSEIEVQNLLLSKTYEFSKVEADLLVSHLEVLNQLGISLRSIGPQSFILDGLPHQVSASSAENIIQSILDEIGYQDPQKIAENQRKTLLANAISQSVRWNPLENMNEAASLVSQLLKCENFDYSPKGLMIFLPCSCDELDKKFK